MEPEFHYQIHNNLPTIPIVTHISPLQIPQTYISNISGLGLGVENVAWELTSP